MSCPRDFSIYRKEEVVCQLKIRGAIEKFKNQPRPLLTPRSINVRQHFRYLSRKTVPLNQCGSTTQGYSKNEKINLLTFRRDGSCRLPRRDGSCRLPRRDGSCRLPRRVDSCRLPRRDGSCRLPRRDGSCRLPRRDGGLKIWQDSAPWHEHRPAWTSRLFLRRRQLKLLQIVIKLIYRYRHNTLYRQ